MHKAAIIAALLAAPAVALAGPLSEYAGVWTQKDGPSGAGADWRIKELPGVLEVSLPDHVGDKKNRYLVLSAAGPNTFATGPKSFARAKITKVKPGVIHMEVRKLDGGGVIYFDSDLIKR
ncbi:hypothetical protein P7B02_13450 [Caulobacter segnis]|uniref:hypothetical protein n=1 Tax=Caulobacter segnis TaxID=88688 RepID=UPI002410915B|nr:hypothetical protein [Caulobacter segnis]MDG2522551.1 hypothetical protein [Caulobacter segnis]